MSTLKVTGTRSILVYCDCGAAHKITVDKNGEYALGTTPKKSGSPGSEPKPKRKSTIFDAPLPGSDDDDDDDEEEALEKD